MKECRRGNNTIVSFHPRGQQSDRNEAETLVQLMVLNTATTQEPGPEPGPGTRTWSSTSSEQMEKEEEEEKLLLEPALQRNLRGS